jgi:hypothetical protein
MAAARQTQEPERSTAAMVTPRHIEKRVAVDAEIAEIEATKSELKHSNRQLNLSTQGTACERSPRQRQTPRIRSISGDDPRGIYATRSSRYSNRTENGKLKEGKQRDLA